MSEIQKFVAPTEPLDRKFESRSGPSFAQIVKNEKTKKNQECNAELMSEPN